MCPDFRSLNNLTIKDRFLILVIGDILDEIHGDKCFTKLDLHLGYHEINMKEGNITKTIFQTHEFHY